MARHDAVRPRHTNPGSTSTRTYAVPYETSSLLLAASLADLHKGLILRVVQGSVIGEYEVQVTGDEHVHSAFLGEFAWVGPRGTDRDRR